MLVLFFLLTGMLYVFGFTGSNFKMARKPQLRLPSQMSSDEQGTGTQFWERIESIKSAGVAAVSGSIAFAPYAIVSQGFSAHPFDAQWEFNHDMLALSIALFGIVYRYAVRQSTNPQLKYGVVGAFVLTRVFNLIHVPDTCSALPLNCGFPFFYVSFSMILEGVSYAIESGLAFQGAAFTLDYCFENKIIKRFTGL